MALGAGTAALCVSGVVGAAGEARTISFYHIHTKETLTVLYKKDGKHIPEALKQINHLMRDWRRNEVITIDPATIDIAWEMHNELGSRQPIHVVSGFRSPSTNSMLRRTRGGQASNSQHITGKAIDIHFPDIPIRQLRYSAMIRERGGVGYYPTSALPFVHVDTARVRAWPRMPRDELALLFPSGRTKHSPSSGGSLTPDDARRARQNNPGLATQVAQFFDLRSNPNKGVLVASADPVAVTAQVASLIAPAPKPAVRPESAEQAKQQSRLQLAALDPTALPVPKHAATPKLAIEPKLVERPSRLVTGPSGTDRRQLDKLVTLASLGPAPAAAPAAKLTAEPQLAARKPLLKPVVASMSALGGPKPDPETAPSAPVTAASSEVPSPTTPPSKLNANPLALAAHIQGRFDNGISWVAAPAFDDDHPEELSYQPFPMAAMLTDTASIDDPALSSLVHPDRAQTLELLTEDGAILPLRLRPGLQAAQLLWSQQFTGKAVSLSDLEAVSRPTAAQPAAFAERSVKTTQR